VNGQRCFTRTTAEKPGKRQTKVRDSALNNIVFTDRKNGWVVGERGLILHTDDGGETWTKQTPEVFERETIEDLLENPPPSLFGVFFTDKNNGFACGIEGTIIATKDGGISWNQIPPVTDYTLYTIFIKDKKGRGLLVIKEHISCLKTVERPGHMMKPL